MGTTKYCDKCYADNNSHTIYTCPHCDEDYCDDCGGEDPWWVSDERRTKFGPLICPRCGEKYEK
jgi:hypothetical protein